MDGTLLTVGQVHPAWDSLAPHATADLLEYNYRGGSHELLLVLDRPNAQEVRSIQKEPARFALVVKGNAILLLFQFGELPWGECGYTIHRVPEAERTLPDLGEEGIHALLTVTLVDRATGRIAALRALTFSVEFTNALHQAIVRQAAMPYNRDTYNAAVWGVQAAHPRIEDLLPEAVVTCEGGS